MPFSAFFGSAGSLVTAGVNAQANAEYQRKQMEHDKEMAVINQANVLQQMRASNQYQVDQWDRENAYNDPSAVRARYEAAGLNGATAFGTGSASGAGIAGGLSSAPTGSSTGHSSNIMPGNIMPDIGGTIATAFTASQRIEAQNKKDIAESELAEQKAKTEKFNREYILPLELDLKSALIDKTMNEGERIEVQTAIDKVVLKYKTATEELNLRAVEMGIEKTTAEINRINQEIRKIVSDMRLTESQRALIYKQIEESDDRMLTAMYQRTFIDAQTQTEYTKEDKMRMEKALVEAQKGHTEALIKEVDKRIEYLGSKMKLNDAQIERWKTQSRNEISKETREWTIGTITSVLESAMPIIKKFVK